jgi:hypothetical protein
MRSVRLRPIALPVEHGGWALVGAPILLGLWVAPSVSGAWLGVAALAVFLARQPAGLALSDWRRGRRYPRTRWAEGFALGYALAALAALACAAVTARGAFWPPLALAAPLVAVQVAHDLASRGRALAAQVCGATASGAVAAAIVMAEGWPLRQAVVPWALLALQSLTAIVYVGARLRLARGAGAARWPSLAAHVAALAAAGASAWFGSAPWLGVVVFAMLAVRAWIGLLPRSLATRTPIVGVQEVAFSLVTVIGLAVGLRHGW